MMFCPKKKMTKDRITNAKLEMELTVDIRT